MQMTPEEIGSSYRRAVNQNAQITILADLNCCSKEEIINILEEQGYTVRKPKKKAKKEGPAEEKKTFEPAQLKEVKLLPEAVRRAITREMCETQDLIDEAQAEVRTQRDILAKAEETLKAREADLETLNNYLKGAAV